MCLAIPGRIKKLDKKNNNSLVDFGGIEREVNISLIKAKKGDYVIVHAGYAIQKVDQKEAKETLRLLKNQKTKNQNYRQKK